MKRKTEKTWILMALLSVSSALTVSVGRVSVTGHALNPVSVSAVLPPKDWSQTYGGSGDDYAYSVVHTSDGGYALAGFTDSSGAGGYDFYLVKTDSNGNMQWSKTYGGPGDDKAYSVIQTGDGGYALAGYTTSSSNGGRGVWLVKTDSAGNMQWNKTYGDAGSSEAHSIIKTTDGGYGLAGFTDSSGAGGYDFYLVKTDSAGNMNWSQTYGGPGDDEAYSVIQTGDGGYALAGYTTSSSAGVFNFWLVKTDSTGNKQWSQVYGSTGDSEAYSVVQTSDNGYALGGYTDASGAGGYDVWLVKTDSTGAVQWSQTYGGSNDDYAFSMVKTNDGGYALAGFTDSSGAGGYDSYLVKTDSAGASSSTSGFNWSSIEAYVIIGAIAVIIIGVVLFILSTRKK